MEFKTDSRGGSLWLTEADLAARGWPQDAIDVAARWIGIAMTGLRHAARAGSSWDNGFPAGATRIAEGGEFTGPHRPAVARAHRKFL